MEFTEDSNAAEMNESPMHFNATRYTAPSTLVGAEICSFLIGLIGNIMAGIVISCSKNLHKTINFYLLNLSVSDVVFLIMMMPLDLYTYYTEEFYFNSSALCFLVTWIKETATTVSISTITVLTAERYLAICHPFVARAMSQNSRVKRILIGIWLIAGLSGFILSLPSEIVFINGNIVCIVNLMTSFISVSTILFFILPMVVITILYGLIGRQLILRRRINRQVDSYTRKTLKMLAFIVIAFFVCWAPFHLERLLYVSTPKFEGWLGTLYVYTGFFTELSRVLSTALHPIIYTFMSENFWKACKDLFGLRS